MAGRQQQFAFPAPIYATSYVSQIPCRVPYRLKVVQPYHLVKELGTGGVPTLSPIFPGGVDILELSTPIGWPTGGVPTVSPIFPFIPGSIGRAEEQAPIKAKLKINTKRIIFLLIFSFSFSC
jgi:hypothetical protein